jgi:hypothetical protein
MLIDTGADHVVVTKDLARALIESEEAVTPPEGKIVLADESTRMEGRLVIKTLTIGAHTCTTSRQVSHQTGWIYCLAFLFSAGSGRFTIDSKTNRLIFCQAARLY